MFALEKLVRAVEKVIDRDHFHLIEKRDGPDYVSVTWQGTGYDVLHILDHTLTVTLERTQVHAHSRLTRPHDVDLPRNLRPGGPGNRTARPMIAATITALILLILLQAHTLPTTGGDTP